MQVILSTARVAAGAADFCDLPNKLRVVTKSDFGLFLTTLHADAVMLGIVVPMMQEKHATDDSSREGEELPERSR